MPVERLLETVTSVMQTAGYQVSQPCTIRPSSFDLICGDKEVLVVIKVVSHIDSVSEDISFDLDLIAQHLQAFPLIVGERARDSELERGAVYIRHGIFAINVATLYDYFVDRIPPLIYASPGGLYVNIDGTLLRNLRDRHNLSLGDLAHLLGVSRRTISKYESGMGTTVDIAARIEELFDTAIAMPIDILNYRSTLVRVPEHMIQDVPQDLERMGMEVHTTRRAPFEVLALFKKETILTSYGSAERVEKRAPLIANISQIAQVHALCIIADYHKQKKIGKTLVIGEERLHKLEDGSELIDLMKE
ncbi:MAG TPA: transcriptional regulator [Methanomicrobiales archaeon]|nr:transcriptional regulator [Methanomicrobiales archaeon]